MQEAYCPPCSDYSFCCPNWVPPLTWLGGVPYLGNPPPSQGTPPGRVPPCQGTPPQGTPPARYPPCQVPPLPGYPPSWTWQGTPLAGPGRVPPLGVCPMAFWEMLQSIMGYGYTLPPAGPGRVPPPPRCVTHGILGNVAKHYGIWVPPPGVWPMAFWEMLQSIMGYGYPPPQVWTDWKHYLPPSFGCGR